MTLLGTSSRSSNKSSEEVRDRSRRLPDSLEDALLCSPLSPTSLIDSFLCPFVRSFSFADDAADIRSVHQRAQGEARGGQQGETGAETMAAGAQVYHLHVLESIDISYRYSNDKAITVFDARLGGAKPRADKDDFTIDGSMDSVRGD